MIAQKWDYESRTYHPYTIPAGWRITAGGYGLNEICQCAQCGKKLPFGDCYTSREIHTRMGMGFAVCEQCYEQEWERERKAKRR